MLVHISCISWKWTSKTRRQKQRLKLRRLTQLLRLKKELKRLRQGSGDRETLAECQHASTIQGDWFWNHPQYIEMSTSLSLCHIIKSSYSYLSHICAALLDSEKQQQQQQQHVSSSTDRGSPCLVGKSWKIEYKSATFLIIALLDLQRLCQS